MKNYRSSLRLETAPVRECTYYTQMAASDINKNWDVDAIATGKVV
ncbi:hypothetical protein [Calothrix sp. NIES-2098]